MIYSFGGFRFDTSRCEIFCGGEAVDLAPRALELLEYLIETRERVVSTDEIRSSVWGVEALSSSAVPTCVTSLRKGLGDDSDNPRFIRTVRRRGYRFIADVHEMPGDSKFPGAPMLVGRATESKTLREALSKADLGHSQLVAIYGNAGVGKTSLLCGVEDHARRSRYRTIITNIPETGAVPPLWPWAQALAGIESDRARLGDAASALESLRARVSTSMPADPGSGEGSLREAQRQFMLHAGIASVVQRAAEKIRLVLLFDDFHRADPDSVSVLIHLQRSSVCARLFVAVATRYPGVRDGRDESSPFAALPRTNVVHLDTLSPERSTEMVRARLGDSIDVALANRLHDQSGGNPFLLSHLIDTLASTGSVSDELGSRAGTSDAVRTIASVLPSDVRSALRYASVLGRNFSIQLLASILKRSPRSVGDVVETARRAGIVERNAAGDYSFRHMLIRDALYDEIAGPERELIHLSVAEASDHSATVHSEPGVAKLAHHYSRALHVGGAPKAYAYALQAANDARASGALGSVPEFLRRAHAAAEVMPDHGGASRRSLLIRLGEAQLAAAQRDAGRATLENATRAALGGHEYAIAAKGALALAPGSLAMEFGVYDAQRVRLIEAVLEHRRDLRDDIVAQL